MLGFLKETQHVLAFLLSFISKTICEDMVNYQKI